MLSNSETLCPICGYDLEFKAWDDDSPSDEICPCCTFQFGYYDISDGGAEARPGIYKEWRDRWIVGGMPWEGVNPPPPNWDPKAQLTRIGISVSEK